MARIHQKRLAKEIQMLATNAPPGIRLVDYSDMSWCASPPQLLRS
jgi:hypothetical protein